MSLTIGEVHILIWLFIGVVVGFQIGWLAGRVHEIEQSLKRELRP